MVAIRPPVNPGNAAQSAAFNAATATAATPPAMAANPASQQQRRGFLQGLIGGFKDAIGTEGSRSAGFWEKLPVSQKPSTPASDDLVGRVGYVAGRVAGDIPGHGTQKVTWNMHGLDVTESLAHKFIGDAGGNKTAKVLGGFGAAVGVGVGSGNIAPWNVGEFGRVAGYGATQASDDDPRKTSNPFLETIDRVVLGRQGRLLQWDEFQKERPDISKEEYGNYRQYLKSAGFGGLGLWKATAHGIEGPEIMGMRPEAHLLGYRITPLGALAGAAAVGATALAVKRFPALQQAAQVAAQAAQAAP